MIHQDDRGDLTLLRLEHGKASALVLELCDALADKVKELEGRDATRAIVLTGTGAIFSAGVDLLRIVDGGADYVRAFGPALDRAFRALFACAKPVVGAVNGHAIAGGAMLAWCCDHRVMADATGRIGAPELQVGVPFPPMAIEIMRFAVPLQFLQRTAYMGESLLPGDALERGLVDEVVAAEATLDRALEVAQAYAAVSSPAWGLSKRQLRAPALERVPVGSAFERECLAAWTSPEVVDDLRRYVDSTIRRD